MKRVDASKPLAFLGVRRYSYQQTEFTSCKNCAITLIIQPLKMSNAIIQQINGKTFLKKKNLKHLALHDDHAASNLLTFGRLFSQGSLRHIYFHATFSWQFDCLFICWESVDFKTLN